MSKKRDIDTVLESCSCFDGRLFRKMLVEKKKELIDNIIKKEKIERLIGENNE